MHVGINLLYLLPGVVGGTETYASGLLNALARIDLTNTYSVFVNEESGAWPIPRSSSFQRVFCPVPAVNRWRRYVFEQFHLPRLLHKHGIDVVHSLGYVSPLRVSCRSVVTIPDLNYIGFGDRMPTSRRLTLAFFVRRSALHCDRIITISEYSKSEITKAFRVPSEKVVVTHLAPKILFDQAEPLPSRAPSSKPYIVAFSSQSPNKNIVTLLRAFAGLRSRGFLSHQLVLVGHQPSTGEQVSLARQLCLGESIVFTGYLDEEKLRNVLRGADALIFPSLYEGFGLPLLEAMALGVPVACSNRTSLPEVAGQAALYFDPTSVQDMTEKIHRLASDTRLQDELRKKGFRNLTRFSWEKTASETLEVYQRAADESHHS